MLRAFGVPSLYGLLVYTECRSSYTGKEHGACQWVSIALIDYSLNMSVTATAETVVINAKVHSSRGPLSRTLLL